MEESQIEKREDRLPQTIEEYRDFILVGEEALKAKMAELHAFKKIGKVEKIKDIYDSKLVGAQNFAVDLLWAMERMGELLSGIPKKRDKESSSKVTSLPTLPKGITKKMSHHAQEFMRHPETIKEIIEKMIKRGEIPLKTQVLNEIRKIKKSKIEPSDLPELSEKYRLFCCDIKDIEDKIEDDSIDWIITDPPYAKEYLYLIDDLAEFSLRKLKKGGSLICMMGQSYLPYVYKSLSEKLEYFWTCAYVTEGRKTILWGKNIMIAWKPLLWFSKEKIKLDKRVIDLFKSDMPEKDIYEWAQSESGMADVIERMTDPRQIICDPFLGAGTTGVAAIKLKRFFIGIDVDQVKLEITKSRFEKILKKEAL